MKKPLYLLTTLVCAILAAKSQVITYSQPSDEDASFFICKHGLQLIGYGSTFKGPSATGIDNLHRLCFYDDKMNLVQTKNLPVPKDIFGIKFLPFNDFLYMFYVRQKKNKVYLEAVKISMDGDLMGPVRELDNTEAVYWRRQNIIYTVLWSENQEHITAFKINNFEGANTTITTLLFDDSLALKHRSEIYAPLVDGVDFFTEFNVDNDGDLVFLRNCELDDKAEVAKKTVLIIKKALSDSVYTSNIITPDIRASDFHLKIDNLNKKYIVAAFYTTSEKRDIDGLYCFVFDKVSRLAVTGKNIAIKDSMRVLAKQPGALKTALNNFSIQNIILRKDGGFIIDAGSYQVFPSHPEYSTWNQLLKFTDKLPGGYIIYSGSHYPWNAWSHLRWTDRGEDRSTIAGGNIMVFSFDSAYTPEWIKFLPVSQLNDDAGFSTAVLKSKLYYVHNQTEKNVSFLSTQVLNMDGTVSDLMFRDIDKAIENGLVFRPQFLYTLSDHEVLISCVKGRSTRFAKIEF